MKDGSFFNEWYKQIIESGNETPPEDIWENISNELDLQVVWSNVRTRLNYKEEKKRRRVSLVWCFFIIGFFFTGTLIWFSLDSTMSGTGLAANKSKITSEIAGHKNNNHSGNNHALNASRQLAYKLKPYTVSLNTVYDIAITVKAIGKKAKTSAIQGNVFQNNLIETSQEPNREEIINLGETIEKICITSIPCGIINIFSGDTAELIEPMLISQSIKDSVKEKRNIDKFYLGGAFAIQNPWLLNHSTYNTFSKSSINESVLGLGVCYGISMLYYFKPNWAFSGNLFIQSRYGQTYNNYNNGTYENKKIRLNYKQLNLCAVKGKEIQFKNKNFKMFSGPSMGVNFKHLTNANEKINDKESNTAEHYSRYDFGLLLGYESNLHIKRKWIFTFSLNGDFGLNNIYRGNGVEPKTFNQTHNSSLRLTCGMMYLIK